MIEFIQKIPILTTVLSGIFFVALWQHWRKKHKPAYLFWWMLGILCYGLGTLTEGLVALIGWHEWIFKAWYILGALLGGFPLAQGSVYLMCKQKTATGMMVIVVLIIIIASVLVILSPINYALVEANRLTGRVLDWKQVRLITPFINIYAFIFLVGGAVYSAYRYSREAIYKQRFWGNVFIAIGGLLPGIGGSFTKFGHTEVLYVTELIGILFIYGGYRTIQNDSSMSMFSPQQLKATVK
jgi:hypothetical protein